MWSYSGDPTSSPKDEVRFLVGDTNTADQQLQDGEISYTISLVYGAQPPASGNYLPAAYCADAIASKYGRQADKAVGDLHISYSQRMKSFLQLGQKLRTRATLAGVPVYAGGQSIAEKLADYLDSDMPQAALKVDGMSYAAPRNAESSDGTGGP